MPTWIAALANITTIIILLGGSLSFPYIPMLFGLYGAERHSLHGKLVYSLIWAFPILAIASLVLSWAHNSLFSLLPIAYILVVWFIRPNRDSGSEPRRRYTSQDENLEEKLSEIDYEWEAWLDHTTSHRYILAVFFSDSLNAAENLKSAISRSQNLISETEIRPYKNNTATVHARITADNPNKQQYTATAESLIRIAWKTESELSTISLID